MVNSILIHKYALIRLFIQNNTLMFFLVFEMLSCTTCFCAYIEYGKYGGI